MQHFSSPVLVAMFALTVDTSLIATSHRSLTFADVRSHRPFADDLSLLFQSGHTPLQRAAAEGHVDVVQRLIQQGVTVDHQDEVVSIGASSHR